MFHQRPSNTKKKQDIPDWLKEGVPKLVCLCARVIRRHQVPYKENNVLPAVSLSFRFIELLRSILPNFAFVSFLCEVWIYLDGCSTPPYLRI